MWIPQPLPCPKGPKGLVHSLFSALDDPGETVGTSLPVHSAALRVLMRREHDKGLAGSSMDQAPHPLTSSVRNSLLSPKSVRTI